MRAWTLNSGFGFENLRIEQRPEPSCGPRQVVIRVRAVSLNARDVMMVRGEYNPRQKLPLVVASDAAGEVVQCGAEVHEWRVGDRVCPIFAGLWQSGPLTQAARRSTLGGPVDGTLTEYFMADAEALVALPGHLSWARRRLFAVRGRDGVSRLVEFAQLQAGSMARVLGHGRGFASGAEHRAGAGRARDPHQPQLGKVGACPGAGRRTRHRYLAHGSIGARPCER